MSKLGLLADLISGIGTTIEKARENVPVIEDEVTVEVVGQPGASKQQLYYLALAAANGVVRRFQPLFQANPLLPPTMGLLMIEYDAADHWVRCMISYKASAASANIETSSNAVRKGIDLIKGAAVYRGPQCEVVGGSFDFLSDLGGIPNPDGSNAPNLPFANQVILTACPQTQRPNPKAMTDLPPPTEKVETTQTITSPNPKPIGDNRSRGAVVTPSTSSSTPTPGNCCPKNFSLVDLVFAALTDPGSSALETWVPPTTGVEGS